MSYEEMNISEYVNVLLKYKLSIISVFIVTLIITPILAWNVLGYRVNCVLNIGAVEKEPIFSIFQLENVLTGSDSFDEEIKKELEKRLTPENLKDGASFKISKIKDPAKSAFPLINISVKGKNSAYVDVFGKNITNKILNEALIKYGDKKEDLMLDLKKELTKLLSENTSFVYKDKELEAQLDVLRKSQKSVGAEKDSLDASKRSLLKSIKVMPSRRESIGANKKVFLEGKKVIDAGEDSLKSEKEALKKELNVVLVRKALLKNRAAIIESKNKSLDHMIRELEKDKLGREEYLSKIRRDINGINDKEKAIEGYEETSLYSLIKSYIWSSSLNLSRKANLQDQEIALMDKIKEIRKDIMEVKDSKEFLKEERANLKEDAAEIEDDIAGLKTEIVDMKRKFYEINQERLETDTDLVDLKEERLLVDEEESQIEQEIVELKSKYIDVEKKFLQYEKNIANVLTKKAELKSNKKLNGIIIEKLKRSVEKLKNDTYLGMFNGLEKPEIIKSTKTPERPILKILIVTVVASFVSLITVLFSVFLLNSISNSRKTEIGS